MRFLFRSLNFLIKLSILTIVFFAILGFYFLWKLSPDLPSYAELKDYHPPMTTRVFTSDGKLLDEYFIEERLFVPIEKIPTSLINAFISAEDKNYYNHIGFDAFSIMPLSLLRMTTPSMCKLCRISTVSSM